ncbi:MAG: flavin reductase [Clostridia bacterium]
MTNFISKDIATLNINPFDMIGKKWMLITAGDQTACNTMTASWGGMGVMWFMNVVNIVIRPQRYTKNFVDSNDTFSLSFFDEKYRKSLQYCGKVSGNDRKDKMENTDLTLCYDNDNNTPYFIEASTIIICKKLYSTPFRKEDFIQKEIIPRAYSGGDFHTLYYGEILKTLIKE